MSFKNKIRDAWRAVRDKGDYSAKLSMTGQNLDLDGNEILDPTPMEPPIGWKKTPHVYDMLRAMVQNEISRKAQEQGFETFEESDDFEDDEYDPTDHSPHLNDGDPSIAELVAIGKAALAQKNANGRPSPSRGPRPEGVGSPPSSPAKSPEDNTSAFEEQTPTR